MKVKDIIKAQLSFKSNKVKFIVKPQGTEKQYYNSDW